MNFERIKEYLRESSNQSRFVLALSLSTVMALAVTTPLAVKAFSVNSQSASEQVIDLKGPSVALLDQEGNTVFVPQAVVPRSGTVASTRKSSTPRLVRRPVETNPAAPAASATKASPTTTVAGDSVTVPISPTETTAAAGSTIEQTSTTVDREETTTTAEENDTTTVEDTETTTDTSVSVVPEPTLSDPPTTAAATSIG